MKARRHAFLTLGILYDALAVSVAWFLAYFTRFPLGLIPLGEYAMPPWSEFAPILPAVVLITLAAMIIAGMYQPGRSTPAPQQLLRLGRITCAAWLAILAFLYFYRRNPYSRGVLALFLFFNPLALWISHRLLIRSLRGLASRVFAAQNAAILGAGRLGQKVSLWLQRHPEMGVRVSYFIDDDPNRIGKPLRGLPVRGPLMDLASILDLHKVSVVFLAPSLRHTSQLETALHVLATVPVAIYILPDLGVVGSADFQVSTLGELPMVHVRESRIQGWSAMLKRFMDIFGASLLLIVFSIPMLIIATLILLSRDGPVLFRQRRIGFGTDPFIMFKFRTMKINAEEATGQVWARPDDPRRTRLGRILRRTSLDELPQLFNVLKGEMSLVGPRPEMADLAEGWSRLLPRYLLRTQVKAGLTGWAQIHGLRGDTSLRKRLQFDLYYINHWSPLLDIYILLLTPFVGLVNRNAY